MVAAVPRTPEPQSPPPLREYEVLTHTCAWGKQGDVIKLALTEGQELSLLQAGTVKRVQVRPSAAVKERKSHG